VPATTSGPALAAAVIAAIASVINGAILAWVALRAQSARDQIEQIRRVVEDELKALLDAKTRGLVIGEILKERVREVMREEQLIPRR
jgi:hypothetical protein